MVPPEHSSTFGIFRVPSVFITFGIFRHEVKVDEVLLARRMHRPKCPFGFVTVEGVEQRVQSGRIVKVSGTPSGWHGTFAWRVGESQEAFEARIVGQLMGAASPSAPTAAGSHQPPRRELAALGESPSTPASQRAERTPGESGKPSPESAAKMPSPPRSIRRGWSRV